MNIGERVGDYEVVQILGAGGMGAVYKVRNVISDRIEAMKVLLPNMSSDPQLAERFLREIKTQAALDHPNIARLHTALQVNNQLFMMMEFVEGDSVEHIIEHNGTVRLSDAISYATQVLDALAYAHARGVVHRDIKPANIMCTPAGVAKLMDFGIARVAADRHLTKTGSAIGSLYYMSPEQINGGQPDQRSDLYSLGVTFYEMVTGQRPFEGDSDFSIMAAHLNQAPRAPMEVIPGVPLDLSDIILVAISKDPAARFQTAEAFRNALKSVGVAAASPEIAPATRIMFAAPPTAPVAAPPSMPPSMPSMPPPPSGDARATRLASSSEMAPPPSYNQAPASASAYQTPPILQQPQPQPSYQQPYAAAPSAYPSAYPSANPSAYPAQAPPPKPASKRGLYMALGSIATVAVLAAGIIEIPKLMDTKAEGNPVQTQQIPSDAVTPVPTRQPEPIVRIPQTPDPEPAETPSNNARPQQSQIKPAPVEQFRPAPQPTPRPTPAPTPQPRPVTPTPVVVQPTPQPTPQPPPQATPQPPPAPAANVALLNQLRQEYNQLSIRATTCRDGLRGLQQQMQRQGLNLRADMREAQTRMDVQLKEATDSMRNGDTEQAGKDLEMARYAIESIEKFLGR